MLAPVMGDGLFTSAGEVWRGQRRSVQPAFARSAHDAFATVMRTVTAAHVDAWAAQREVDLAERMSSLTLDIVLRALFGSGAGEVERAVYAGLRAAVPVLDQRI